MVDLAEGHVRRSSTSWLLKIQASFSLRSGFNGPQARLEIGALKVLYINHTTFIITNI